ncbi:hypothetical protein IFM89_000052 [Coptis chinensis]|uniref:Reverse transcriptase zinc-binding domain-containing protein n=1 Tax=Coptis chinensis TaxID=261450 RepID=A0A835IT62_9MAGN|nr:hypothetical protein IFM89_000052 [Coptis chinensis]
MFVFTRKLKLLKKDIKLWAKSKFSNLEKRIDDARIQLEAIQRQLQAQPRSTSLAQEEHSLTEQLADLKKNESNMLKHKSKTNWDINGEEGTNYFYKVVKERKARNSIWGLIKENGERTRSEKEVREEIEQYYKKLLGTPHERAYKRELLQDVVFRSIMVVGLSIYGVEDLPRANGIRLVFPPTKYLPGYAPSYIQTRDWNRATISGLVYKLATKQDNLWVKWMWANKIKSNNFWTMTIPKDCSWSWRNILDRRVNTQKMVKKRITDGTSTSFWHDPWLGGPLLAKRVDASIKEASGIHDQATVSTLIIAGTWNCSHFAMPAAIKKEIQNTVLFFKAETDRWT